MAGVLEYVLATSGLDTFGLDIESLEMIVLAVAALSSMAVLILLLALRKRGRTIEKLKFEDDDLKDDLKGARERLRLSEADKARIAGQHEEALSKLKEAKETILQLQNSYQEYKAGLKGGMDKTLAMEDELKIYRLKLGELNKEKEKILEEHIKEKKGLSEQRNTLVERLEKEISELNTSKKTLEKEFEDKLKQKDEDSKKRIDEIKKSTKEAMLKLTSDKDKELESFKSENEKLKKQLEALKNEIRVLEIEKL